MALIRAELAFVTELVRRVTEENWGPVDLWRASCRRQARVNTKPEPSNPAEEAPM